MRLLQVLPAFAFAYFLGGRLTGGFSEARASETSGVIVVAGANESAAPDFSAVESLARSVYAKESFRPALPEADVESLLGGALGDSLKGPRELAPYLSSHSLRAAIVVDHVDTALRARLFLAKSGTFDFAPLPAPQNGENAGALRRIDTALAGEPTGDKRSFYESYWFWGAVGGAALIGLIAFAATAKTDEPDRSHLVLRFP